VLSNSFPVTCGVPQASCLGPILFLFYVSKLFEIIKKHLPSSHGYADDTQLYLSFCPESSVCQNDAVRVVEACIKFNDLNTEFLLIGTRQQLKKIEINSVRVARRILNLLKVFEMWVLGLIKTCLWMFMYRKGMQKSFQRFI
jgi:hypothetical protein